LVGCPFRLDSTVGACSVQQLLVLWFAFCVEAQKIKKRLLCNALHMSFEQLFCVMPYILLGREMCCLYLNLA